MASIIDFFYPPSCLHCHTPLDSQRLFCPPCIEQLTPLDCEGRCPLCFVESDRGKCPRCCKRRVLLRHTLSASERLGPAHTLALAIQAGRRGLIPAAASLMAYQWADKQLASCDALIPVPISLYQRLRLGTDLHLLLAHEIGKLLSIPVVPSLRRHVDWDHFLAEAEMLPNFKVSNHQYLEDKSVLLISLSTWPEIFFHAWRRVEWVLPPNEEERRMSDSLIISLARYIAT
jgi:predicted amidophosphoribosyltransferase